MLTLDETDNRLHNPANGQGYDPATRTWSASPGRGGTPVSLSAAAHWLQRRSGHPLKQPVAVIGPRDAGSEQLAAAEALGVGLAGIGFSVVCGGRQGIMEAVCRGVASGGGISIGLLPETDVKNANPYVTIPIATGIGEARNVLVARAGFCIVAIGDSYGTLSEVALGLQFGRPVLGLCGAAKVEGVRHLPGVDAAIDAVAAIALGLPG
ncbi:MAG: DNA-binding protein [Pseudolabrys sp.]|nr:DNA-binding protein [Pseudolabrys sp.]MDP2296963.1 DNA-binding protein [Pseudolabrys sp.]